MVSASPWGAAKGPGLRQRRARRPQAGPVGSDEQTYPRQTDPSSPYPLPLAQAHFRLGFGESGLACAGQISARMLANRGC